MLFIDTFIILDVNPGGRKSPKVDRYFAVDEKTRTNSLIFDYPATTSFKLRKKNRLLLTLCANLVEDNKYQCILHGQIFQVKNSKKESDSAHITFSFGGLLMNLKTTKDRAYELTRDKRVYMYLVIPPA